ncbi:MAG: ATP-grasp domain-containing protein [Denitrovibrio sp.]|nr:MAG: ATP-grasp domain-containing protein [Denitrovibrio sp.]
MFIFDEPFVSDVLFDTVVRNNYPVLNNEYARNLPNSESLNLLSDERFIECFQQKPLIYTNSENAITWINKNLMFSDIIERIEMFKNKVKFRDLLSGMYPDFYYKEVLFEEIEKLKLNDLQFPFIIKPAVGFFSLGVYYVEDAGEWKTIRGELIADVARIKTYYPADVLDSSGFIIEQVIEGVEYAVDGYYNSSGEPVVLNVLKHDFAGAADVSDRVYMTSVEIVKEVEGKVLKFLDSLSRLSVVKNFPFHLEIRIDDKGKMIPIEMNPMRFAGWCCTDVSVYAYGFSTYEYFMQSRKPEWKKIEQNTSGVTAMCVIEKGAHINDSTLKGFDYEKLKSKFKNVLALRETDYKKYGVFAFMFLKVDSENSDELKYILNSDLTEFLITD